MSEQLSDERVAEIKARWENPVLQPGESVTIQAHEIAALAREVLELRGIIRLRDAVYDLYPTPDLTGPVPRPMNLDP